MNAPLSRCALLRRAVLLCSSFVENLAFYRAAMADQMAPIRSDDHPHVAFLRRTINNFINSAVLDWCKLFGNRRQEDHHWRNVVSDPSAFERALLGELGMTADEYEHLVKKMLDYRNNFLAHLGKALIMTPPELTPAHKAVVIYHRQIFEHEGKSNELVRLPNVAHLALGFAECTEEAIRAYRKLMEDVS